MADGGADPFPKLGSVYRASGTNSNSNSKSKSKSNQSRRNAGSTKQNAEQTGGGSGVSSSLLQNTWSSAWAQPNLIQKLTKEAHAEPHCENNHEEIAYSESDNDDLYESDDEVSLDDTDSDTGEKSHEGAKKSKWFKDFFARLSKLTEEEINSSSKRWHCPACQRGAGAIDWFHGLQPLLVHARTIKIRRVALHRLFAKTLEEECYRRRAPLTSEPCGLWEGLHKNVKDHQIVWPPAVIIMNTRSQRGENNKWTGMGSQELLDCFRDYAALKAKHAYGPMGHRGMSILVFDDTAAGYLESVRLHKHFKEQGRDREAWGRCRNPFVSGGKRQLYGYLASKEDMDIFNQHGKSKSKYVMKSYQEMVEREIKHINDDTQQLDYFKNKAAKEELISEVLANTLSKLSEKLRQSKQESRVVIERTKEQQQQTKEEMDAQEKFFLDQIQIIRQAIEAKADKFGELQLAKFDEGNWVCGDSSEKEDENHIMEKVSSFIESQTKEIRQFAEEKINIMKIHRDKKLALKKKQLQEQVELEKELENEMMQLMDKYASDQTQEGNNQK